MFLTEGFVVEKRVEAEKLHTSCWIFPGKHSVTMQTCVFSRGHDSRGQREMNYSCHRHIRPVVLVQSLFKKCRLHLYMSVFKISQQIWNRGRVIEVLLSYPDHIYVVYVVLGLCQRVKGLNLVVRLVPGGFSRLLRLLAKKNNNFHVKTSLKPSRLL